MIRTRINVPCEYEKLVKEHGAKYDGRMKSFYVPEKLFVSNFNSFIPLAIELIPSTNWEKNVRSEYASEWDAIRRAVYKKSNYVCEICGGTGKEHPVEAHEVFSYDMTSKIQKLIGIRALCPLCHRSCHYGLALINKEEKQINKHIMKVNGWTEQDVSKYINEVFYIFDQRSKVSWELDLSLLDNVRQNN